MKPIYFAYHSNLIPELRIEGGSSEEYLGEARGGSDRSAVEDEVDPLAGISHPVERLRPPLVARDAQAVDGRGHVAQLRYLLGQGQLGDDIVHPLAYRLPLVAEQVVLRLRVRRVAGERRGRWSGR